MRYASVERGCVPDVSLSDKNTGVMDGLGQSKSVDAGLKTALQEIFNLKSKHVIELHTGLVEDTNTDKSSNQGVTLEKTLGILLVKGEKLTAATPY